MAITKKKYKTLSADPRTRTHEFLVDSVADLDKLPKETGSAALVASIGDIYVCNNAKEWKNISNTGIVETLEPTGTINITQNGTIDVTEYATANVNIPNSGGSADTIADLYIWNAAGDNQIFPNKIQYLSGVEGTLPIYIDLEFEQINETYEDTTIYGVNVHDVPVGSLLYYIFPSNTTMMYGIGFGYSKSQNILEGSNNIIPAGEASVPRPLDGWFIVGVFNNNNSSMPSA